MLRPDWASDTLDISGETIIAASGTLTIRLPKPARSFRQDVLHILVQQDRLSQQELLLSHRLLLVLALQSLGEQFSLGDSTLLFNGSPMSRSALWWSETTSKIYLGVALQGSPEGIPFSVGLDEFDIPAKEFSFQLIQAYLQEIEIVQTHLRHGKLKPQCPYPC